MLTALLIILIYFLVFMGKSGYFFITITTTITG